MPPQGVQRRAYIVQRHPRLVLLVLSSQPIQRAGVVLKYGDGALDEDVHLRERICGDVQVIVFVGTQVQGGQYRAVRPAADLVQGFKIVLSRDAAVQIRKNLEAEQVDKTIKNTF